MAKCLLMMSKKDKNKDLGNPALVSAISKLKESTGGIKKYPGFFTLVGTGVLAMIGTYLYRRGQDRRDDKKQKENESTFSNNLAITFKDKNGVIYYPNKIASQYKQALSGLGTSEQALMDLARVSKYGRWSQVAKAYKQLTGRPLVNDIQDDLTTNEYTLFNKILNSPYWYAIGENMYPKKSTINIYNNGVFVPESFVWGYQLGRDFGKIISAKRVIINGKITEVYKTADYPNKWMSVNDIMPKYDRIG